MDNSGFEGRSEGARRAGEKLLSEVQTEGLNSVHAPRIPIAHGMADDQ